MLTASLTCAHLYKLEANNVHTMRVEARGVTVAYGDEVIFREEDLLVEGSGLYVIIGPNGAGKTTLFKVLLGLIRPVKGRVFLNGQDVTGRPEVAGKLVGYVPQLTSLDFPFPVSVEELVESAVALRRRPIRLFFPREERWRVEKVMEEMGIKDIADKPLGSLSGGQRQRALIARALVWDPQVLFMDEPVASVDPRGKAEIAERIKELSRDRMVLVSSHDPSLFLDSAKEVIVVNRGIVAKGRPADVMRAELLREVYGGGVSLVERCVHLVDSHIG